MMLDPLSYIGTISQPSLVRGLSLVYTNDIDSTSYHYHLGHPRNSGWEAMPWMCHVPTHGSNSPNGPRYMSCQVMSYIYGYTQTILWSCPLTMV
ncbi:hypothetical protein RSAG8_13030, partial [Rhizoctonia solani AG-8 WAC10335]